MDGGKTGQGPSSVCHRECLAINYSESVLCLNIVSAGIFSSTISSSLLFAPLVLAPFLLCLFSEAYIFVPIISCHFHPFVFPLMLEHSSGLLHPFCICSFANADSTFLLALVDALLLPLFVVPLDSFQLLPALTLPLPSQCIPFSC